MLLRLLMLLIVNLMMTLIDAVVHANGGGD